MSDRGWLIVADDATGALDSAVGFAGTGRVQYARRSMAGFDVTAISTGSRAHPTPPAAIGLDLKSGAFRRLFVKIDSTLRGWPAEHLAAAAEWWGRPATAVICPAAPLLGRTVRGGRAFVHGNPVTASASAHDPVAPVHTDDLRELFDAPLIPIADLADAIGRLPAVVVDATTNAELDRIAAIVDTAGEAAVPVGSAGLAAALGGTHPSIRSPRPRCNHVVVLMTSVHPVSREQLSALGPEVPIVVPPPIDGRVTHRDATAVAFEVAAATLSHLRDRPGGAVVAIGGDGADALLSALDADGVEVVGSVLPGVPWGFIRGGVSDGTLIVTKSGGFGRRQTLADIIRILTEEQ